MKAATMVALMLFSALTCQAGETTFSSGPARVSLLELYTSEGCSSCPPADQWLSELREDPRLWHEVVPVAFHVDYWDSLGWPDRFADAAHTMRQHEHARSLGMRTVYTPGLFLDGQEWRRWFGMRDLALDAADRAGDLRAVSDGADVQVHFRPQEGDGQATSLEVHVALLGFGLDTEVGRGENAGRRLRHDFVVLQHHRRPLATGDDGMLSARLALATDEHRAKRLGLAVWVSRLDAPAPLQATGGWLTP